jgi:acetate kinase
MFMASLLVLVLNSGSSSIKFSVYEAGDGEPQKLHEGSVDGIGTDQGKFWINPSPAYQGRGLQTGGGCAALEGLPLTVGHRPPNGFGRPYSSDKPAHHSRID